jgi:hypothetical protein
LKKAKIFKPILLGSVAFISRLKNNAEKLKGNWYAGDLSKECVCEGKYLDVNQKKLGWIKYMRENFSAKNLSMSKIMQLHAIKYAKAMNIQKYNASAGWLDRFKNWYGFKNVNLHGEICDVNFSNR